MRAELLLKKYLQSGLSNDERLELEKLALEDAFVADAWEGLHNASPQSAIKALDNIAERLDHLDNKEETRVVPLYRKIWPYAVAASLLLAWMIIPSGPTDHLGQQEVALVVDDEPMEVSDEVVSISSDQQSDPSGEDRMTTISDAKKYSQSNDNASPYDNTQSPKSSLSTGSGDYEDLAFSDENLNMISVERIADNELFVITSDRIDIDATDIEMNTTKSAVIDSKLPQKSSMPETAELRSQDYATEVRKTSVGFTTGRVAAKIKADSLLSTVLNESNRTKPSIPDEQNI